MINTVMLTLILFEYCFFFRFLPLFFFPRSNPVPVWKKKGKMKIWKPAPGFFSLKFEHYGFFSFTF